MKWLKLDVGCGCHPTGDVNCDLYVKDEGHRSGKKAKLHLVNLKIDTKEAANFVLCDSQHLPFKDGAFEEAVSSHVIEHVRDPALLVREMLRVARREITVKCPHRLGERRHDFHLWHFKCTDFNRIGAGVTISEWRCFPNNFFPLFRLPLEMTVKLRRRNGEWTSG
jgi:ubiquinone/menaquinone biosynthesis C-methylase UbiE